MAAGRIVLPPYMPTRNRDGLLVDQARLTVYENETTVKATIYSDDGLTTPQANPVIANSSGQFPPIWAEAGTTGNPVLYSLAIADASGASVGNPGVFDNWQPSVDGETAASVLAEAAADSAAASAIDAAASATVAEGALDEILAAAAASPETLPLLNKANLNGGNVASTGNAADFRQNIGAVGSAALAAGTGAALVGFIQPGTGAVARTVSSKLRERVSAFDFIPVAEHAAILAGTSTYDATTALNNAHAAARLVFYPTGTGVAKYNATQINVPFGGSMIADGKQTVEIWQVPATDQDFIVIGTGGSGGDITAGGSIFSGITIRPADVGKACIKIGPNVRASMLSFSNVVLKSQHWETLGSPPYTTTAGSVGIDIDGTGGSSFLGSLKGVIIQSFDIAIRADDVVNDWTVGEGCWILDCRIAIALNECSIWRATNATFESGVANARVWYLQGTSSHIYDYGCRWELTQSGSYGIEFVGGFSGQNIKINNPNLLIPGDGGSIPGRKWTGTPPTDFLFEGYYQDSGTQRPFTIGGGRVLAPSEVQMGGTNLGNGKLVIQRNAGGNDGVIENDGTNLTLNCPNGVKIIQPQGGVGYQLPFFIGSYAFWVDSSGRLRINAGYPGSDTAGTVVGAQT